MDIKKEYEKFFERKKNDLCVHDTEDVISFAKHYHNLQLHKTKVSGSFLVLTHAGSFVDYNLLPKGIYTTSIPQLFSKDITIEILEQQGKMSKDLVGNYFVPESFFENLKKCTLTSIDLV